MTWDMFTLLRSSSRNQVNSEPAVRQVPEIRRSDGEITTSLSLPNGRSDPPQNAFGSVEEVYIPIKVAKEKMQEVEAEMAAMKAEHLAVINELEGHYKDIEKDMQQYFMDYIQTLKSSAGNREKEHLELISKIRADAASYKELAEKSLLEANNMIEVQSENIKSLEDECTVLEGERNALDSRLAASIRISQALLMELDHHREAQMSVETSFRDLMNETQQKQAAFRSNLSSSDAEIVRLSNTNTEMKNAIQTENAKLTSQLAELERETAANASQLEAVLECLLSTTHERAGCTEMLVVSMQTEMQRARELLQILNDELNTTGEQSVADIDTWKAENQRLNNEIEALQISCANVQASLQLAENERQDSLQLSKQVVDRVAQLEEWIQNENERITLAILNTLNQMSAPLSSFVQASQQELAKGENCSLIMLRSLMHQHVRPDADPLSEGESPAPAPPSVSDLPNRPYEASFSVKQAVAEVLEVVRRACEGLLDSSASVAAIYGSGARLIAADVALSLEDAAALTEEIDKLIIEMSTMAPKAALSAAEVVRVMAEDENKPHVAATAQVLLRHRERLEQEQSQLAAAVERIIKEKEAVDSESVEGMDEEERTEYIKIRKKEYEAMEKKLHEKQAELQQHLTANESLQAAMAITKEGKAIEAEEAQRMIESHAVEMEQMRVIYDQRLGRLQAELADTRAALSAEQEALQDEIFDLKDQVKEEALKLSEALTAHEAMAAEVEAAKNEGMEKERVLNEKIIALEEEICKLKIEAAANEAVHAAADAEKAEHARTNLEDQVELARKALKEAESRDKEEAKKKGDGAKVVRSEAAKAAYWDYDRLTKEVDEKKKEIEEAGQRIEHLKQKEAEIMKEAQERSEAQRLAIENELAQRRAALELEIAERQEQAKARLEEQARIQQMLVANPSIDVESILADVAEDVKETSKGRTDVISPAPAGKAAAKAKAQVELKKEVEKGGAEGLAQRKAMAEASKKLKQMEANNSKLQQKIQALESDLENAKAAAKAAASQATERRDVGGKKGGKEDMQKKREDNANHSLDKVRKDLADLEKDHKKLQNTHEATLKELEATSQVAKQAEALKKRCSDLDDQVKDLKSTIAETQDKLEKERRLRKKYLQELEDMKGKIRVYARCRPFAAYEKQKGCKQCIRFIDDTTCEVDQGKKGKKEFTFDEVFTADSKQEQIFDGVSHLVQSAVDGFNVCIFAYGQTGSGKTFTMYGKRDDPNLWGIAPRAMQELFSIVERDAASFDFTVSCYMLELYNDQLIDLLADRGKKGDKAVPLNVQLDTRGVVVVQGAVVRGPCRSFEELYKWNEFGINQRHVASTAMNAESSRSHLLFSILVESKNKTTGTATVGKMTLVDLAGSERQSKTQAQGDRMKEAISINKSLSALGDVISALSTGEKIIPYRNNKLTHVLQDGLGGNAKTLMFVNISPADYNCDETATSLIYASRVKNITNSASKQVESAEVQRLKKIISELQSGKQIAALPLEADETPLAEEAADDSKYLNGPDFEREAGVRDIAEEEAEPQEADPAEATVGSLLMAQAESDGTSVHGIVEEPPED